MDNKKVVGTVMLDFSTAFIIINHELLITKLSCYDFSSAGLSWIESYLSDRKQRVFFNGSVSERKDVSCGVPQSSCLGPLLFSIFTNELPCVLKQASMVMLADDSTMFSTAAKCK